MDDPHDQMDWQLEHRKVPKRRGPHSEIATAVAITIVVGIVVIAGTALLIAASG